MADTDQEEFWTPEGVGPHSERELELMLAGTKPMAAFMDEKAWGYDFGEDEFDKYVGSGELIKWAEVCDFPRMKFPMRYVYYARPEEVWRISVFHALHIQYLKGEMRETPAQAEITGRLLGYSHEEIQAYVQWVSRCRVEEIEPVGA